ncbi:asparaginase [Reyranella sp. CPCC 100927]|uniref:asparaginase n=1 Tax=Reyranella sp. CPCC 100927 TaxID=2599616 RepID=UPI001C49C78B|nr:asparaginase [Reyranella sp. CPCC 100927]
MSSDKPVVIEVTRGNMIESRHVGAAAVMKIDGSAVEAWGDIDSPVMARSAIKPLQAIPLVESGAADRFGLTDMHLSLACASHNGEPRHVEAVRAWLGAIGLGESDLECGAHAPTRLPIFEDFVRSGAPLTAAFNNCSGKHTGFLTTAMHKGEPTRGYIRRDHPVQQRLLGIYEQLAQCDLTRAPLGIDGCGIPTVGVPLRHMALAMANLANPARLPEVRAKAIRRIRAAMNAEPFYMAGTGRFCTRINGALKDVAQVKTGAEGVYCGMLPTLGLGVALKIWDGNGRAAEVALAAILRHLGVLADMQFDAAITPPVLNVAGLTVGDIRPAASWLGATAP